VLHRPRRSLLVLTLVGLALFLGVMRADAAPSRAPTTPTTATKPPAGQLSSGDAVVLGLVEGITEYLPVSSTGHLIVTERLLRIVPKAGLDAESLDALDSYTVIIQIGAILAVLVIFWKRIVTIVQGLLGKNKGGRQLLIGLVIAFIPAAVFGKALESTITKHLLRPFPVAEAWLIGGAAIFAFTRWFGHTREQGRGAALETITIRQAAIIGGAQVLALWPGTSRSLVTILAALLVGLSLSAAVEFSFLLGLLTLSAATGYELLKNGSKVHDIYGTGTPLIGIAVAGVAAVIAVKWMVGYLNRHDLKLFGYYRIAAGILTIVFLASKVIANR
jgi:undecaprenyl-diphosphatase